VPDIPDTLTEAAAAYCAWPYDEPSPTNGNRPNEADYAYARGVLAAALSVCTVRDEWRARITHRDGTVDHTVWYLSRDAAEKSGEYETRRHYTGTVTVEHRLIITTPPAAIPQPERTSQT